MNKIRASSVQFEHAPGDKPANLNKVRAFVEQARAAGSQIIAFPECCLTGYWFLRNLSRQQMLDLAEPVPQGPCCQQLLDLSRQSGMTIGAGLIERTTDDQMYNAYFVAMPDGQWRCHRKIHAFVSEHLTSGSEYTVFDTPHGCRVGVLICYDNNIVENVRITALMGADILLAPHQTGGCVLKDPHSMGGIDTKLWEQRHTYPQAIETEFAGLKGRGWLMRWLPARAHDSGLFLVFSNGVGVDDGEIRTGNAMILDPYGRILQETGKAGDDMVTAVLDPDLLATCSGRRWMKARRPELYAPLTIKTGIEQDTRALRMDDSKQ